MSNKSNARRNRKAKYQQQVAKWHQGKFNQIIYVLADGTWFKEWITIENGKKVRNRYL